ncbi:MAG: alpha/beta fold hydrolase [Promethearchaeota archaeon]
MGKLEYDAHGSPPFAVLVVHGGPGAAGGVRPVALELAARGVGVLEPIQTAKTVDGQVEELRATIEEAASTPVVLVGHSWGAWLCYIVAARHPALVRKLVLVGSGPFEEKYAKTVTETRLRRLGRRERGEYIRLLGTFGGPKPVNGAGGEALLSRLGELSEKADGFDALPGEAHRPVVDATVFSGVSRGASELRRSGELLELGRQIRCPVVAIHGDHDPHPAEGVRVPLSKVLADFEFVLLEKCGHNPWAERQARESFYDALLESIGRGST